MGAGGVCSLVGDRCVGDPCCCPASSGKPIDFARGCVTQTSILLPCEALGSACLGLASVGCLIRDGDEVEVDAGRDANTDADAEAGLATDAEVYWIADEAFRPPGFSACPKDLAGYVSMLPKCP